MWDDVLSVFRSTLSKAEDVYLNKAKSRLILIRSALLLLILVTQVSTVPTLRTLLLLQQSDNALGRLYG